jgi:hypothetical protein
MVMPLIGWAIYFVFKFILSVLIGHFIAPFYIGKRISNFLVKIMYEREQKTIIASFPCKTSKER